MNEKSHGARKVRQHRGRYKNQAQRVRDWIVDCKERHLKGSGHGTRRGGAKEGKDYLHKRGSGRQQLKKKRVVNQSSKRNGRKDRPILILWRGAATAKECRKPRRTQGGEEDYEPENETEKHAGGQRHRGDEKGRGNHIAKPEEAQSGTVGGTSGG